MDCKGSPEQKEVLYLLAPVPCYIEMTKKVAPDLIHVILLYLSHLSYSSQLQLSPPLTLLTPTILCKRTYQLEDRASATGITESTEDQGRHTRSCKRVGGGPPFFRKLQVGISGGGQHFT